MTPKRARTHRTLDDVAAEHMRADPEFGLYHLAECAKDPEPRVFLRALKQVVEAQPGGLAAIARKSGVDRAGLYRSLAGPSVPNWNTVTRVLRALNVDISFQHGSPKKPEPGRRAQG